MGLIFKVRRHVVSLAVLAGLLVASAAPAAASTTVFGDGHGLHILSQRWLDSRLVEVTMRTAALPQPVSVRMLVPTGYAAHPRRRYPVLLLFDGTSGRASDWTTLGGAEQTTAGLPLIVVMPDITLNGDGGGWCTNWPSGAERWETFHIDQLLPWVDGSLRTIRSRADRAIAGLSQGGFCSMSYAARHPDLFGVALSYSGAPDIYYDPDARAGAAAIINATEVGLDRVPPYSMFGDQASDGINWADHDPTTLAENLRFTRLFMYVGTGLPGPYDSGVSPAGSAIEGAVYRDTVDFHNRLDALGIPSLYDLYGNGTHSWPYWARDLRWSIGAVMQDFAHPLASPRAIYYQSADPAYSAYGWSVVTHRAVREFSTLSNASRAGFTLAGSGAASVTTPPVLRAARCYRVTVTPIRPGARSASRVLRAGRSRRLTVEVPLGPSNPYQQNTAQAQLTGTKVYSARVTIRPL